MVVPLRDLLTATHGIEWQRHVNELFLSTGMSDCAICSLDGTVWAQSGYGFDDAVFNTQRSNMTGRFEKTSRSLKLICDAFADLEERRTLALAKARKRRNEVAEAFAAGVCSTTSALHALDGQNDIIELIMSASCDAAEPDMRSVVPLAGECPHFCYPHFGDRSYMFLGSDADGQELHFHRGRGEGIVFAKCRTCMVIGTYRDSSYHGEAQPGRCRAEVGKLADFLRDRDV